MKYSAATMNFALDSYLAHRAIGCSDQCNNVWEAVARDVNEEKGVDGYTGYGFNVKFWRATTEFTKVRGVQTPNPQYRANFKAVLGGRIKRRSDAIDTCCCPIAPAPAIVDVTVTDAEVSDEVSEEEAVDADKKFAAAAAKTAAKAASKAATSKATAKAAINALIKAATDATSAKVVAKADAKDSKTAADAAAKAAAVAAPNTARATNADPVVASNKRIKREN